MKHASIALLLLAFLCAHDADAGTSGAPPTRPEGLLDLPDDTTLPESAVYTARSFASHRLATQSPPKDSVTPRYAKQRRLARSLKNRPLRNSPIRNRLQRHAVQNLKATVVAARKSLPPAAYQKIESQLQGVTKKYTAKPGFNTLNTKQLKAGLILAAAQDAKFENKKQPKQTKTAATPSVLLGTAAASYEPGCCCSRGNDGRFVLDAGQCGGAEEFTQTCAADPASNTIAADCTFACCATILPPVHGLVSQLLQLADADMKK